MPDEAVPSLGQPCSSENASVEAPQEPEQSIVKKEDRVETMDAEVSSVGSWDLAEVPEAIAGAIAEAVEEPALAPPSPPAPSARVITTADVVLGVEAQEDVGARGDVTAEFGQLVVEAGAKQAFRAARVALPAGLASPVPTCVEVLVANDGEVAWPESTAVVVVAGDAMGFPHLALGAVLPGEAVEVQIDLLLPQKEAQHASRSAWAIIDSATGTPLGPLIFVEGVWVQ